MIRNVSYRVDVLRRGVAHTQLLFDTAEPPNIIASKGAEIQTSFSGTFRANSAVDWLGDELQPMMILDGVEHPLGIYIPTTVQQIYGESGASVAVEAYDRSYRLQEAALESRRTFTAGTRYTDVVGQLLTEAGIALQLVEPSTLTLATDREDWDLGTPYLRIINQLLGEINYDPVWLDARGFAHAEPYRAPDAARIAHSYSASDLLQEPLAEEATAALDVFGRANVFVVRCSNPDLAAPLVATAVNDNPLSSLSTVRRGRRIVAVSQVDQIASQAALQAYADRLCNESMLATQQIQLSTLNEPGHGLGDVIAVDHPGFGGIYEETGWSMSLGVGQLMTHEARKVVII